jgi:protein-disulfide isomerase
VITIKMDEENEHVERRHEHNMSEDEGKELTIKIKKQDMWKYATFIFAALLLVSLYFNLSDNNAGGGTGNAIANPPTVNTGGSGGQVKVTIDDSDPVLGDPNAEITIVEFSDFQCPFCARAATGAVADFKKSNYFSDGQVNLVYKHFPLNSIHPEAQKSAEASVCAGNQGKFWEFHDLLFANQQSLSVSNYKAWAQQLGLNQVEFDSCLDGGDAAKKVSSDLRQASEAGGRGTPYFVVVNKDGETQAVSGAVPFSQLESAIQSLS